jgi:hypothetical protein
MILIILNDHSGKLVIAHFSLKELKKSFPTVMILLTLNDHSGKLVNFQYRLKQEKKLFPTVPLIFDVSNEFTGKVVSFQK